jgi:hypothetical protein
VVFSGYGKFRDWVCCFSFRGVSLGDKKDSRMDMVPPLDVVHRPQSSKKPQVLLAIQSSSTSPNDDGLVPSLDEIHRSQSVKKTQTTMSVDVGFLQWGFLKPRPSRSRGCSSPESLTPAVVKSFFGTSQRSGGFCGLSSFAYSDSHFFLLFGL